MPVERDHFTTVHVKKCLKENVFHKVKFLHTQESLETLDGKNSVSQQIMRHLKIKNDQQERWWAAYKDDVHYAFNDQRSICNSYMKEKWISAFF